MSSKQDLIEMQEVIKQCLTLIKDLSTGWDGVVKSINKINSNKPSTYIATQKELKQSVDALNDSEVKLSKSMERKEQLNKKIQNQLTQEERLLKITYQEKEKVLNQETRWQVQLTKSENLYTKIQAKVNATTQAYNNLAAKKALGIDLNDKEQRTLALLEARLNKYQGVLKGVDANIGKYQRNVGNYASGWNGLSNSINQITREMPAFAVSMNTGFLALSNNIPILLDEIQRVNTEVKTLRAQGKPTEGVLTRLASSFFSLQTMMSLGVTLLTIYGADILKWANNAIKGASATNALAQSQEAYNEALKSSEYTQAYSDVTKVTIALEQYKKGIISTTEFLQIYNNTLGDTFGKTNDVNKAESLLIANGDNYVKAMLARASANNLLAKSAELNMKILEQQQKGEVSFWEKTMATIKGVASGTSGGLSPATLALANRGKIIKESTDAIEENRKAIANFYKEFETLSKGMNLGNVFDDFAGSKEDLNKALEEALRYRYEEQKSALELQMARAKDLNDMTDYYRAKSDLIFLDNEYNINSSKLQIKNKENLNRHLETLENNLKIAIDALDKEEQESKNARLAERIKKEKESWQKILDFAKNARKEQYELNDLDSQILLEQAKTDEEAFAIREKQLEDWFTYQKDTTTQGSNERLKAEKEYQLKSIQLEKDKEAEIIRLRNETEKHLKGIASNVLGDLGAGSLAQFFNGEFEAIWKGADTLAEKIGASMKAIGDVMKDALNQISALQQANFEAQLSRLEIETEVALKFAGDSATGREAIEKQADEKRREIKRKQAQQEKKMAIFTSIINVAQGITASLAQGGVAGIIMAALIGVLGAVQIASIASQPLPAFWTGTDNAPEGLALTQERGAEMITDKNGKIKTLGNNKGAQLTYLNKGDKVYNASDTTDKINEMLLGSGISPIVKVENNGLTEQQLRNALNDTLARQPRQTTKFDEKGVTLFIERENSRTIKRGRNARI